MLENQVIKFIDIIKILNERYFEMELFEHECNKIHALANKQANTYTIKIQNIYAYRSFRWDKYQVILSDMLSLLDNELNYDNSITQKMHILINYNLDSLDGDKHVSFIKYLKYIYNIDFVGGRVYRNDNKTMIGKLSKFRKKILSERHYLSHKYDSDVINKYESNLKEATKILKELKTIITYLTWLAKGMYFLYEHDYLELYLCKSRRYVIDQIDLIFFSAEDFYKRGSIIYDDYDSHRRTKFYMENVNRIIEIEPS